MNDNGRIPGRLARYLRILICVTLAAYMARTFSGMLLGQIGMEASSMYSGVAYAINLLAALITASWNRRRTFRSTLAWWIAVPVMVVLEMLFDTLGSFIWRPVMEAAVGMAPAEEIGAWLSAGSVIVNLIQFTLWAALSYLFQRFVLYRNTLDSNGVV